jgi:hypothetical protein
MIDSNVGAQFDPQRKGLVTSVFMVLKQNILKIEATNHFIDKLFCTQEDIITEVHSRSKEREDKLLKPKVDQLGDHCLQKI